MLLVFFATAVFDLNRRGMQGLNFRQKDAVEFSELIMGKTLFWINQLFIV